MTNKIFKDRRLWLITIIVFLLLIIVFDKNNLIEAWKLKQNINALEQKREYYQKKISQDSLLLHRLGDDAYLEQFAREKYLMKRDSEVIYIIK